MNNLLNYITKNKLIDNSYNDYLIRYSGKGLSINDRDYIRNIYAGNIQDELKVHRNIDNPREVLARLNKKYLGSDAFFNDSMYNYLEGMLVDDDIQNAGKIHNYFKDIVLSKEDGRVNIHLRNAYFIVLKDLSQNDDEISILGSPAFLQLKSLIYYRKSELLQNTTDPSTKLLLYLVSDDDFNDLFDSLEELNSSIDWVSQKYISTISPDFKLQILYELIYFQLYVNNQPIKNITDSLDLFAASMPFEPDKYYFFSKLVKNRLIHINKNNLLAMFNTTEIYYELKDNDYFPISHDFPKILEINNLIDYLQFEASKEIYRNYLHEIVKVYIESSKFDFDDLVGTFATITPITANIDNLLMLYNLLEGSDNQSYIIRLSDIDLAWSILLEECSIPLNSDKEKEQFLQAVRERIYMSDLIAKLNEITPSANNVKKILSVIHTNQVLTIPLDRIENQDVQNTILEYQQTIKVQNIIDLISSNRELTKHTANQLQYEDLIRINIENIPTDKMERYKYILKTKLQYLSDHQKQQELTTIIESLK